MVLIDFIDKKICFSYTLAIMSHTTIHIKTDTKTRDDAKKIAEEFGFSLTSLVNVLLKQVVRNNTLTLTVNEQPSEYMVKSLHTSEEDAKAGRVISFESGKDALAYLAHEYEQEKQSSY